MNNIILGYTGTEAYLKPSAYIDFNHPAVLEKAADLANGLKNDAEIAEACFKFVKDSIKHSWDYRLNPVICKTSDVVYLCVGLPYDYKV